MIDYGDGNINLKTQLTKSPPYFVGIDVPKSLPEPIVTDSDSSEDPGRYDFYLYNLEFKYDAVVKGFEVYAYTGGGYYLSIFDPCNGTNVPCIQNNNIHQTYLEKRRWIPSNRHEVLNKGYNFIPGGDFHVIKSWMVYLYINAKETKIAWNTQNNAPRSDYTSKGENNAAIRLHSTENWALFIRAQVDRYEEIVEIEHVYNKAGTYKLSVYEVNERIMNSIGIINVIG